MLLFFFFVSIEAKRKGTAIKSTKKLLKCASNKSSNNTYHVIPVTIMSIFSLYYLHG